ncbi:helix-turn-helix domain-containing protein [Corynebacterium glyciniphilum]|uniref:helix-turn-helix domain-containing protein n=1 Tax=Corynebacterium glyciniphilum TaxID=1404244 RepID=UPI0011AB4057|nr:helix-turn-helix transcriptional regulator [Corynebacterium glyciniphilum]
MDEVSVFGRRLRHARLERGMSQTALASGICSASAVSRWEGGQSVPPDGVISRLAERLGLSASLLTAQQFDSRLLASWDGFGELITVSFSTGTRDGLPVSSPMASWISRARYVLTHSDPWADGDPRPVVDDLAVDPLTTSTPVALETVELLDAVVTVRDNMTADSVDALVDALVSAVDAPGPVRQAALETAVAVLVTVGMPAAARSVVARVAPPEITLTCRTLLAWEGDPGGGLPPVQAVHSARDVALDVASRHRNSPDVIRSIAETCQGDGLVTAWICQILTSN